MCLRLFFLIRWWDDFQLNQERTRKYPCISCCRRSVCRSTNNPEMDSSACARAKIIRRRLHISAIARPAIQKAQKKLHLRYSVHCAGVQAPWNQLSFHCSCCIWYNRIKACGNRRFPA